MGLDFGYTCGTIDSNIEDFQEILKSEISSILDDACPLLEGEQKTAFIKDYADGIYEQCQNIFEDVRKCNEDMRQQAELQISDLESEKEDLEDENGQKDTRIEELEYDLGVSEDRCAELEAENQTLQEEYE